MTLLTLPQVHQTECSLRVSTDLASMTTEWHYIQARYLKPISSLGRPSYRVLRTRHLWGDSPVCRRMELTALSPGRRFICGQAHFRAVFSSHFAPPLICITALRLSSLTIQDEVRASPFPSEQYESYVSPSPFLISTMSSLCRRNRLHLDSTYTGR